MRRSFRIPLLVVATIAADYAWGEPSRYCGEDYWFAVESPKGWEIARDYNQIGVTLTFHPTGEPAPAIMVVLPLGAGSMEPQVVDLQGALTRWVGLVSSFGSPSRIQNWDMRHPTQPTESAVLEGEGGRIYLSIVDAGSGRGHTFAVFLGQAGGTASTEMLRAFQTIVSSLHFDATRICKPGPEGQVVERRIDPTRAAAAPAPTSQETFPIQRAMSGCETLQLFFVPVYCSPAREGKRAVWVVSFDDGDDPANTYLKRFRGRITTPWCWAARGRSKVPGLLFTTKGSDSLREYSCEASGWVRTVQIDRLEWVD